MQGALHSLRTQVFLISELMFVNSMTDPKSKNMFSLKDSFSDPYVKLFPLERAYFEHLVAVLRGPFFKDMVLKFFCVDYVSFDFARQCVKEECGDFYADEFRLLRRKNTHDLILSNRIIDEYNRRFKKNIKYSHVHDLLA